MQCESSKYKYLNFKYLGMLHFIYRKVKAFNRNVEKSNKEKGTTLEKYNIILLINDYYTKIADENYNYYAKANMFVTEYRKYVETDDKKWDIHVKEMTSLDEKTFKIKANEELNAFKEKMLPFANVAKSDTLNVRDAMLRYINEKFKLDDNCSECDTNGRKTRKLNEDLVAFLENNRDVKNFLRCRFCGLFSSNLFRHIFKNPCHKFTDYSLKLYFNKSDPSEFVREI